MNGIVNEKDPEWLQKWMGTIEKIDAFMKKTIGKKVVVLNIEAGPNPQENYERYMEACRIVKNVPEIVVTVSLPGEERIFWVNQDVQFYIQDGNPNIQVTGNQEIIQELLS